MYSIAVTIYLPAVNMHAPSVILNIHLPCHRFSVSKGLGMFHKAQNFETQCQKEMAGLLVRQ